MKRQIDLLYFDGCPSWQNGLANLQTALAQERIEAEIRLIQVADNEDAARLHFLGSPSFQIDGFDLWSEKRSSYALSCRVYATPQGMLGAPNVEMLRKKIHTYMKMQSIFDRG